MVDGPVCKQMPGQFNEDLFMSGRTYTLQSPAEDDVGSLVSDIEPSAALYEFG
jgi:hypothetical protein